MYDAKKDHECLESGLCDNPDASAVNLSYESIYDAAKVAGYKMPKGSSNDKKQ